MGAASGGMSKEDYFCVCMLNENYVIDEDNKWLMCEGCNNWCHHKCNLLTDTEYDIILNSKQKWYCVDYQCQEKKENDSHNTSQSQYSHTPNISLPKSNNIKPRSKLARKCKEIEIEANENDSKSEDNVHDSSDLVPCLICNDNKLYKRKRGLKAHCRRKHTNHDEVIPRSEEPPISNSDDLNEFLLMNEDQSNSKDNTNSENSQDLVPCLLCKDGKLYKRKLGLKIHCMRKHKNEDYSIMFVESTKDEPFDINSLLDRISYYKRNIRLLKRIPKGARATAAYEFANVIENAVEKNDPSSWEDLLLFPFKALQVPDNNKRNLTKLVKNNINSATFTPSIKKWSSKQASLAKRVESKVSEGDLRGAVKLLSSSDTLAKVNVETYQRLLEKHPLPSRTLEIPEPPVDLPYLIVDEKKVADAVFSFPNGSSSGIDGLAPQHLKDMISKSTGEAGTKLLSALTKLSNLMLSGNVCEEIITIVYGANLCALTKDDDGIRPIAVGCCYRRLSSKLACRSEFGHVAESLFPKQVGVATKGGCEAAIHAVRSFVHSYHETKKILVKVDLRNAFNSLERDDLLKAILKSSPNIYRFMYQCYHSPTTLFYGDYRIPSAVGVQQGDPSGPLIFSEAIQPIIEAIKSELNVWFLDDGTLIGDIETVKNDLLVIREKFKAMGLEMNVDKCELYDLNLENSKEQIQFLKDNFPGMKVITGLTLLGAPITQNAVESVLHKKINKIELLCSRLNILNKHVAYFILKHCFGIPKLTFLIRTTPLWKFPNIVNRIDSSIKSTIEAICNVRLDDRLHSISSLPCRFGGLGVRKVNDIMLPAFLSSVYSTSSLINNILGGSTSDQVEVAHFSEGIEAWTTVNNVLPNTGRGIQRIWDEINITNIISSLQFPTDKHTARFKASLTPEASLWLSSLPSKNIGTLLDDNTFRISVALRLGSEMCNPYTCICGKLVDVYGSHALSCLKCTGRYSRHREFNCIIARTLRTANVPAILEPQGLFRDDGKRTDGVTLTPWSKGSRLTWDATCVDTLANSYFNSTKQKAGSAAERAATHKINLYKELKSKNYIILPFAVETLGPWCKDAIKFTDTLGKLLVSTTGEVRSKEFFKKNIQRGNATCIMESFPQGSKMEEIFYII